MDANVENKEDPKVEEPKVEDPKAEETVPKDRFEEVNTRLKDAEDKLAMAQQQAVLAQANRGPAPAAMPQFDIFKEVGLDPDDPKDLPNQEQLKKIMNHFQGMFIGALTEQQFLVDHPDFAELVGTPAQIQTRQWAKPLAEVFKSNPALQVTVFSSNSPREAAYNLAKLYQEKKETGEKKPTDKEAQDAIEEAEKNATRTKSLSTVKGGAALSEEGRYAGMSDEEVIEKARSHGANI